MTASEGVLLRGRGRGWALLPVLRGPRADPGKGEQAPACQDAQARSESGAAGHGEEERLQAEGVNSKLELTRL